MSGTVRDLMTPNPIALDVGATAAEAASLMKEQNVGDVLVVQNGALHGIVTDRDLVVRCLASGDQARDSRLEDLCSTEVTTLGPDSSIEAAVRLMEKHAIRRLPVVENGAPIGILSLGDLARARDPQSALGKISSAAPSD